MQYLLARAVWDEDRVRDHVRDYLVEHLGDPQGVLVVDETGDLKKGAMTVGPDLVDLVGRCRFRHPGWVSTAVDP